MSANPKRVVYLIDSLCSGGAQRQFVEMIKGLDKSKIFPVIVIYHDNQHYRDELDSCGVLVLLLKKTDKIGITFFLQFYKFLKEFRPTVIHSFLNIPNFYARLTKVFKLVDYVITSERNSVLTGTHKLLEKVTWRLSDHIIVNAQETVRVLENEIGIPVNKISFIPNGIDVAKFSESNNHNAARIKNNIRMDNDAVLLGVIGRICEQKGQKILIEACHLLSVKYPQLKIKVCFWGSEDEQDYCNEIKAQITSAQLEDVVCFQGVEKDVASVLAVCDFVVLPSLWEGLPNALIEAMAAARPVIATKVADNEKIIHEGETGFLVSPNKPDELAEKIYYACALPKDRRALLGVGARKFVSDNYSLSNLVERTMLVYKDLGVL